MKKLFITLAFLASIITCGCVVATGSAQRSADGATKAHYTLYGAGATAQQAVEGLAIDADETAPGVALKKASNAQDSTAALQALVQLGTVLAPLLEKGGSANTPLNASLNKETSVETESADNTATASSEVSVPKSIAGTNGAATVIIIGNRASCGYCRRLWSGINTATLSANLCGATITDADKTDNPTAYAQARPQQAFDYPLVLIYGADGSSLGQFVARNYTQAALETKIKTLIPACASTGIATQ